MRCITTLKLLCRMSLTYRYYMIKLNLYVIINLLRYLNVKLLYIQTIEPVAFYEILADLRLHNRVLF